MGVAGALKPACPSIRHRTAAIAPPLCRLVSMLAARCSHDNAIVDSKIMLVIDSQVP